MENYLHYLIILIAGLVAFISLKYRSVPKAKPTSEIDKKVKQIDDNIKPPDTTGVENNIAQTGSQITEVENSIQGKENKVKETEAENPVNPPLTSAESAANWVNSVTNKTPIVFFLCISNLVFAADPLYPGKPYTPKQEGVALSLAEINSLKEKVEQVEKLEKLNAEYISLLEDYRKMKELQTKQIDQFAELDKMKQESIVIYKEAITSYKDIIGEMRENSLKQEKQLNQQRRMSRFQRNLNFILGFAAPILGARALDQLGR